MVGEASAISIVSPIALVRLEKRRKRLVTEALLG